MTTSLTDRQRLAAHLHRTGMSTPRATALLDAYRDQVLTEAADLLAAEAARGIHIRYGSAADYADHYRAVLLAARTGQEG